MIDYAAADQDVYRAAAERNTAAGLVVPHHSAAICGESRPGPHPYICTRAHGHTGRHVARGHQREDHTHPVLAVWATSDTT